MRRDDPGPVEGKTIWPLKSRGLTGRRRGVRGEDPEHPGPLWRVGSGAPPRWQEADWRTMPSPLTSPFWSPIPPVPSKRSPHAPLLRAPLPFAFLVDSLPLKAQPLCSAMMTPLSPSLPPGARASLLLLLAWYPSELKPQPILELFFM